ncbi:MAG: helix-turn-helix domain-containing protein [Cyanobacteria bacterium P01_G01_bin.19]
MSTITPAIKKQWVEIAPYLTINNDSEYDRAIERLNSLIDEVGTDIEHPLYSFLDTLGIIIEAYEEQHYSIPNCSGVDILVYFMEEYFLSQSDLPEIGSQGVVSEIINGKRELNLRQIKALAKRFNVSPGVFL